MYLTKLDNMCVHQQAVVEDLSLDVFGDLLAAFCGHAGAAQDGAA